MQNEKRKMPQIFYSVISEGKRRDENWRKKQKSHQFHYQSFSFKVKRQSFWGEASVIFLLTSRGSLNELWRGKQEYEIAKKEVALLKGKCKFLEDMYLY